MIYKSIVESDIAEKEQKEEDQQYANSIIRIILNLRDRRSLGLQSDNLRKQDSLRNGCGTFHAAVGIWGSVWVGAHSVGDHQEAARGLSTHITWRGELQ